MVEILGYVYAVIVGLGFFAAFFFGIPALVRNDKFAKLKNLFAIASDLVYATEQEFGILEKLEGETDEEYLARKEAFNCEKKEACREAIIEALTAYGLPVPAESVIDSAIEYGVKAMNIFLGKK